MEVRSPYGFCPVKVLKLILGSRTSTLGLKTLHIDVETFLLPTDAHNVKKHRVIKTF